MTVIRTIQSTLVLAALAAAVLFCVARAAGEEVRLHDEAGSAGPQILLREVAELKGEAAAALGDVVVGTFEKEAKEAALTLAGVRSSLDKADVNWGRLSLRGYSRCRVVRIADEPAPELATPAAAAPNVSESVDLTSAVSLRDRVTAAIVALSGRDAADVRVGFTDDDEKTLAVPALGDRFEIEPQSASGFGRVPVIVRRWRGESLVETIRVNAESSWRVLAAVTTRSIPRGHVFDRDSVEIREVFIDRGGANPVRDLSSLLGHESSASLRKDAVVFAEAVRSPVVVRRGEPLTVRCIAGNLVLKVSMRSLEEGAIGDMIEARNDTTRQTVKVRISGAGEAVLLDGVAAAETRGGSGS